MIFLRRSSLACPYFVPLEILNDGSWQHPARLPLGAGWSGSCCATGHPSTPDASTLHDLCNLGNAVACPHLPRERDWDAVRFSVARDGSAQITLWYVCELEYAPVEHGKLFFDRPSERWLNLHSDPRLQRLADCYLKTYRAGQNENRGLPEGAIAWHEEPF